MDNLNVSINVDELKELVKTSLFASVTKSLEKNKVRIESSLDEYFAKSMFSNASSTFESSLDWAVESVFREGLEKAMIDLNFKEMIANKCKEILSSNDFITTLANIKVRTSLGLPLDTEQ